MSGGMILFRQQVNYLCEMVKKWCDKHQLESDKADYILFLSTLLMGTANPNRFFEVYYDHPNGYKYDVKLGKIWVFPKKTVDDEAIESFYAVLRQALQKKSKKAYDLYLGRLEDNADITLELILLTKDEFKELEMEEEVDLWGEV